MKFHGPHADANGLSVTTIVACTSRTMRAFKLADSLRRADQRRQAEARLGHTYSMRPGWKPNVMMKAVFGAPTVAESEFTPSFTTYAGSARKES